MNTLRDGLYCLYPGTPQTIPISLYCKNDVNVPGGYKEFVDLLPGSVNTNYWPGQSSYTRKGGTSFTKIRIDTTNLRVIGNDYTFAVLYGSTGGTTKHPYGTGGGCSLQGKLLGSFHIDLVGTKFKVKEGTTWTVVGFNQRMGTLSITNNWQRVHNKCDGYCGSCSASGGLYLQIYKP
ncbi:A disintegrin and metalloproteinase with thrombospondin motifs 9-like [Lineus longissimus]|uniref:A disintegrin and metalloproteinase with thrombospondin motifs 9-like n=1 Tax=Lineus longissimus TaxID=88925 RepID=UPI00315DE41A